MAFWHWWGRSRERDFDEELESHFRLAVQERVAAGEDLKAARLAARREFGNVTLTREATRRIWRGGLIEWLVDLEQDVRYATRLLRRSPGYVLVVVIVLALGIGASASVFSLYKSAFLRPLPGVDAPQELAVVVGRGANGRTVTVSYPDYEDLRERQDVFTGLAAVSPAPFGVGLGPRSQRVWGERVSGNYFAVLGVEVQLGRTIQPDDERESAAVAVISEGLWQREFGTDPAIIGQTVLLNAEPVTVVGVAEPGFHGSFLGMALDIFAPVTFLPRDNGERMLDQRGTRWLMLTGRLAPGVSLEVAEARMAVLGAQLADAEPREDLSRRADVLPLWRSPFGAQPFLLPIVAVLAAMSSLVLIVVCTNLAGLVLARGLARRGEVAVRCALGASRLRIVRLLLLENLMLAVPAAAVGLWVASWTLGTVGRSAQLQFGAFPTRFDLTTDGLLIGFALAVACGTALLFGFVPALRASRVPLSAVMKEEGVSTGPPRARLRRALVVVQVAAALLLLVASGLTMQTVSAAREADAGFDPADTVSVSIDVALNDEEVRTRVFYENLLDRLRSAPGVESAAAGAFVPLMMVEGASVDVEAEGYAPAPGEDMRLAFNVISPGYFSTLRIQLIAGRAFSRSDAPDGPAVVVVNQTLARRYFGLPEVSVGRYLRVAGRWREIVGVVSDVKYLTLTAPPAPYFYLPLAQNVRGAMTIHARSGAEPETLIEQITREVGALDPNVPVLEARPLTAQFEASTVLYTAVAGALALFGLMAVGLAAVGIYGLVAYTVTDRTHEIGVRMALGAGRGAITRRFLGTGVRLAAVGAAGGTLLAFGVTRLMGALLFGVSPTDPLTFGVALALVLGIALLASFLPAWRAARMDPVATLHHH